MKKITIIFIVIMLSLPLLLQAQYLGGNGRGDVSVGLTNISISVKEIKAVIPTKYNINQNYPNPFNPTTNIIFAIPNLSDVKIAVYDISGKEIEVLVNEQIQAGTYQTDWNASNYASGVYFARIQAEEFQKTIKMTVLK